MLNSKASVEVMQDKNVKDTRYPNRFKVIDGINGQFTEISADTSVQMNEWVEAIKVDFYQLCKNIMMKFLP